LEAVKLWKSSGLNGLVKRTLKVDELGGCRREEKWKRRENGGLDAQLALTGMKELVGVAQRQARRSLPYVIESG
jgi:hypothetical protein